MNYHCHFSLVTMQLIIDRELYYVTGNLENNYILRLIQSLSKLYLRFVWITYFRQKWNFR